MPPKAAHGEQDVELPAPAGGTHCPTCATGKPCAKCHGDETMRVSDPDDASESFATAAAHQLVTGRSAPAPGAGAASGHGRKLPPSLGEQIQVQRRSGVPLPSVVRERFEDRLGPLGDVRVHTDATAARLAHSLDASAFTVGRDIFFGRDAYAPDRADGERLLAHELTHVVHHGHDARQVHRKGKGTRGPERTPCQGTSDLPGNPTWKGTWEHLLIQQYYVTFVNPNAEAEYWIPESGPHGGGSPADLVDPTTGIIFEIKHVSKEEEADAKVLRSIAKAEEHCGDHVPWHAGQFFPFVELSCHLPDQVLVVWRAKPGVILYRLRPRKRKKDENQQQPPPMIWFDTVRKVDQQDLRDDDDDQDQPPAPYPIPTPVPIIDPRVVVEAAKDATIATALAYAARYGIPLARALKPPATALAARGALAAGASGGSALVGTGGAATGTSLAANAARFGRLLSLGSRAGIIGGAAAITFFVYDALARYTYTSIYIGTRGSSLQRAFARLGEAAMRTALAGAIAGQMQDVVMAVGGDDIDNSDYDDMRDDYLQVLYQYRLALQDMFAEIDDAAAQFSAIEDQLDLGLDFNFRQSIESADAMLQSGDQSFSILTLLHSELDNLTRWAEGKLDRLVDNHVDVFNRDFKNWVARRR